MTQTFEKSTLAEYVDERQRVALETYRINPDLLEEHVKQEATFRTGGYGERQVSELLQNAADALTVAGVEGRIEFRMADGALYCANEGAEFSQDGVRALCHAFLSTKLGDEIGRFGLGFKSVLGISDHPQIYSKSIGFQFNGPNTANLFEGIPAYKGEWPVLRVPSPADTAAAGQADPHLQDLLSWASTVVKLPLTSGGSRIRAELENFRSQSLLFMKSVKKLDVTLQDSQGSIKTHEHRREGEAASGLIILHSPKQEPQHWLFAERTHVIPEGVLRKLSATANRHEMTVSYAVPLQGSSETGRFWAWFPLKDVTTARGIFNAPWEVNDDRTSMIPTSPLNGVLLDVCAELFLDVVVNASTSEDPAAHLDLFPARGREARGPADGVLSERIPALARRRRILPDKDGALQYPSDFTGVPELSEPTVPHHQMAAWQAVVPRTNIPHWKCFTTATRTTRLRSLVRTSDNAISKVETSVAEWLTELSQIRTATSVSSALDIFMALRNGNHTAQSLANSLIIPTENEGWASATSNASVLLPVPGQPAPDGLTLVDRALAGEPKFRALLQRAGFQEVSPDQVASALAAMADPTWQKEDWVRFWAAVDQATGHAAKIALQTVRDRDVDILVKTRVGYWRPATEIFVSDNFAPQLDDRHPDSSVHGHRGDLLSFAGGLTEPADEFELWKEPIYEEYVASTTSAVEDRLRAAGYRPGTIAVPEFAGAGPLQLFHELVDDEQSLAGWTLQILIALGSPEHSLTVPLVRSREQVDLPIYSPEMWAIQTYGRVQTSLGYRALNLVAASSLGDYSALIPVVSPDVSARIQAPSALADLSDSILKCFLERHDYYVDRLDHFTDLLLECVRYSSVAPPRIPAVRKGNVALVAPSDVVIADGPEDVALLNEHEIAYVDGSVDNVKRLRDRWGLQTSEEALSRSIEVDVESSDVPLLDRFPSLSNRCHAASDGTQLGKIRLRTTPNIIRKTASPAGILQSRLMSTRLDNIVTVDDSLDDHQILTEVSQQLDLRLSPHDINDSLLEDERLRRNELIEASRMASSDPERLALLVGTEALKLALPRGLLVAVESKRGKLSEGDVAELYSEVTGYDSLRNLRYSLQALGLNVPSEWVGSDATQAFVRSLGFSTHFAGIKSVRKPNVTQVQGRIELNPLHPFQEVVAEKVRDLALVRGEDGDPQRGLLFLPTGAGKTRVAVEAIARMLLAEELAGPILWIAQSRELCDQAIQTWTDVWRAIGDERVIEICRFWDGHDLDESTEELQIVVAVDDTIRSRIDSPGAENYDWLSNASFVVVDEAHTAGSPTYTKILRWLGLTSTKTKRPLLGLTATPYRGRSEETNKRFVDRFGRNRLESLDPDDPIGELRRSRVLAKVDHAILDGMQFQPTGSDVTDFNRMGEVTKSMLDRIGQNVDRTQTLVADVLSQDDQWPILIFTPSVSSAHTVAALLRLEGRSATAVDGATRGHERRRVIDQFRANELQILINCDLLTQGFDAPNIRALYVARPTFSPNLYHQMIGRGLRGPENGGKERCLIVNMIDTFDQFGKDLAYTEFDYLWRT